MTGTKRAHNQAMSLLCHLPCACTVPDVPACYVGYRHHASTRCQVRTDGGGGKKKSAVPEY